MSWAYQDGAFVPAGEARVAADDRGLLYGRGLFETFRARGGRVYLLDRHVDRLRAGGVVLNIDAPAELARLPAIVAELAERCELADARMRLTLTAGPANGRPSLVLEARPATDYPAAFHERGVSAVVASVRRNETSPLARIKSLNCLDNLLAREEARRTGADDALLLNTQGAVAELSTANLFAVRGGAITTPRVADGALPGVTRGAILELAKSAGMSAGETALMPADLREADEAFLTNAVAGVLPLVSVNGESVGLGSPGEITRRVHALYEKAAALA